MGGRKKSKVAVDKHRLIFAGTESIVWGPDAGLMVSALAVPRHEKKALRSALERSVVAYGMVPGHFPTLLQQRWRARRASILLVPVMQKAKQPSERGRPVIEVNITKGFNKKNMMGYDEKGRVRKMWFIIQNVNIPVKVVEAAVNAGVWPP